MSSDDELGPLFDGIKSTIKNRFGRKLTTVEIYEPLTNKTITTPAVLIELINMSPGHTISGKKIGVDVEFVAHCVLSIQTENIAVEVANFAASVIKVLDRQRWGLSDAVDAPKDVNGAPGMFKPDSEGFESMAVSWTQTIRIGDDWELPDDMPKAAYFGESPHVGGGNEGEYEKIP